MTAGCEQRVVRVRGHVVLAFPKLAAVPPALVRNLGQLAKTAHSTMRTTGPSFLLEQAVFQKNADDLLVTRRHEVFDCPSLCSHLRTKSRCRRTLVPHICDVVLVFLFHLGALSTSPYQHTERVAAECFQVARFEP